MFSGSTSVESRVCPPCFLYFSVKSLYAIPAYFVSVKTPAMKTLMFVKSLYFPGKVRLKPLHSPRDGGTGVAIDQYITEEWITV